MNAPALLLIDIQIAFDSPIWGARNNPQAEAVAGKLLTHWRAQDWPVFHIQHVSKEPGSPLGHEAGLLDFKPEVTPLPGEPIVQKHVNSAFIGTDLEAQLRKDGLRDVVI
jgi:nicotinamidase-related amidase